MLRVEPAPPPAIVRRARSLAERRQAVAEFVLRNSQSQPPTRHIEVDLIAITDCREWSSHRCLRCDMQDNGPIGGPAHPGIRDADHIPDPL